MIPQKKIIIILTVVFLFGQCGRLQNSSTEKLIEIHGQTMGTTYMVKVVKNDHTDSSLKDGAAEKITSGIESLLNKVNQQMSTWLKNSEISRFNRFQDSDWFDVSLDLAEVVNAALQVSKKSNGAFDVTAGPIVNLWGFGPQNNDNSISGQIPSDEQINNAMTKIGYQKLSVRLSPPALRKEVSGIYCDLSAIAKGYGVDKTGEYLESLGFKDYLVDIGGEVRTGGNRPDGQPWRIAIASPNPLGTSSYQKVIQLRNIAMATSGDYFNYFEKDGVRYSHTIDPTTGKPITHKLASVTVIHNSCMIADAMATAIDVLGPIKGYELALKENLPVFLIIRSQEKDKFIEKETPPFADYLIDNKSMRK